MTTVTRIEYDPAGNTRVLGLPGVVRTEEWDGEVREGGLTIDDAFWIESIKLRDSEYAGLMGLAARIARVKLQPRLIPTGFTVPTVIGLPTSEEEGSWEVTRTDNTVQRVLEEISSPDLQKAVGDLLGIPIGNLWKMSKEVSGVLLSGATALMDGRKTMLDYPTPGATEVVWVSITPDNLRRLALKEYTAGKSVLYHLLVTLGLEETIALQEQEALKSRNYVSPETAGGAIVMSTPIPQGKSHLVVETGTPTTWVNILPDGTSVVPWPDNQSEVYGLLAMVARKTMDHLMGLTLVGVAKGGVQKIGQS